MAVTEDPSGRNALQHLDRAIASRPVRDGRALSEAVGQLAAFRDVLIAAHRQEGGPKYRSTLDRINAVMSVILAAEFPIGEIPWEEVDKARSWLVDVVGDQKPQ